MGIRIRKYRYVFFGAGLVFALGCKKSHPGTLQSDGHKTAAALALFKDQPTFDLEDVKKGKVCGSVQQGTLHFGYKPWPQELKTLLANELADFDLFDEVAPHVEGYYLADFLADADQDYLGLTCQDAKKDQYVVLMSTRILSAARNNSQIDVDAYTHDHRAEGIPVLENRGDSAVQTMIHETFHVVDLAYFWDDFLDLMNGRPVKNMERAQDRLLLLQTSWNDKGTTSLYDDVLYPGKQTALLSARHDAFSMPLDHVQLSQQHTLRLIDEGTKRPSLEKLAALENLYRAIAEKTNFVSYYATVNFIEDFAVTLEKYYLGKKYDMYERAEFFAPMEPFVFPSKNLLTHDTPQRRKVCLFVGKVFKTPCF